jgi:hypothetical protein
MRSCSRSWLPLLAGVLTGIGLAPSVNACC